MFRFLLLFFLISSLNAYSDVIKDFTLPVYNTNKTMKLSELVKKVLINFWASWCTSCIHELEILEKLKKENPDVEFVAINAGENKKKIKRFLKKYDFSYLILMDKNKKFSKSVGVLSLPQTFIIGKNNEVLYKGEVPPIKI